MTAQDTDKNGKGSPCGGQESQPSPLEEPPTPSKDAERKAGPNDKTVTQGSGRDGKTPASDGRYRANNNSDLSCSAVKEASNSIKQEPPPSLSNAETKTEAGNSTVPTDPDIGSPPRTRFATPDQPIAQLAPKTSPVQDTEKFSRHESLSPPTQGGNPVYSLQRVLTQSILQTRPHKSQLAADSAYQLAALGGETPSAAEKVWEWQQDNSEAVWNEASQRDQKHRDRFEQQKDDVLYDHRQAAGERIPGKDLHSWEPPAPHPPPADHEAFYKHKQVEWVKFQQYIASRILEMNGEYSLAPLPDLDIDAFVKGWAGGLGMVALSAPEAQVQATRVMWRDSIRQERDRLANELGIRLKRRGFLKGEMGRVRDIAEEARKRRLSITPEYAFEGGDESGDQKQWLLKPSSLVKNLRKMMEEAKDKIESLEVKVLWPEKEQRESETTAGSRFASPTGNLDPRTKPLVEELQHLQLYIHTLGQILAGGDEEEVEQILGGGYEKQVEEELVAQEERVTEGRTRLDWAEVELEKFDVAISASQRRSGAEATLAIADVNVDTTGATDEKSGESSQSISLPFEKTPHEKETEQLASGLRGFASIDNSEILRWVEEIRLEHAEERRKMATTYAERMRVKDEQIRALQEAAGWGNPEDGHGACKAEIWQAKLKGQADIQNMREKFAIQLSELEAELKAAKESLSDQEIGQDAYKRRIELLRTGCYMESSSRSDAVRKEKDREIEEVRRGYDERIGRYDDEIECQRELLNKCRCRIDDSHAESESSLVDVISDHLREDAQRTIDDLHEQIAELEADKDAAERALEALQASGHAREADKQPFAPRHIPSLTVMSECSEHKRAIEQLAHENEELKRKLYSCGGFLSAPRMELSPTRPGGVSSTVECAEHEEMTEGLQNEADELSRELGSQDATNQTPGIVVTAPSPTLCLALAERAELELEISAKETEVERLKQAIAEQEATNSQLQARCLELEHLAVAYEQEDAATSSEQALSDLDFKRWLARPMRLPVDDEDLAKHRSADDQWVIRFFTQVHQKRRSQIRDLQANLLEAKMVNETLKAMELDESAKDVAKKIEAAVTPILKSYKDKLLELQAEAEVLSKDRVAMDAERAALKVLEADLNDLRDLVMKAVEPLATKLGEIKKVIEDGQMRFFGRGRRASDEAIDTDAKAKLLHYANPYFCRVADLTAEMENPIIYAKKSMDAFWNMKEQDTSMKELFGGIIVRDAKIKRLERDLGECKFVLPLIYGVWRHFAEVYTDNSSLVRFFAVKNTYLRFREQFGKLKDQIMHLESVETTMESFKVGLEKICLTTEGIWITEAEGMAEREDQALSHSVDLEQTSEAVVLAYGQELATATEMRTKHEHNKRRLEKRLAVMERLSEEYKTAKESSLSDIAKSRKELRDLQLEMRQQMDQLEAERDVAILNSREFECIRSLQSKLDAARLLEERRTAERDLARDDADEARERMNTAVLELLAYKAKKLDSRDPGYKLWQENQAVWKAELQSKISNYDNEKRIMIQRIKDIEGKLRLEKTKHMALEEQATWAGKAEDRVLEVQRRLDRTRTTLQNTQDSLQVAKIEARTMEWKKLDEYNEKYMLQKELDDVQSKLADERQLSEKKEKDLETAKEQQQRTMTELQTLREEHAKLVKGMETDVNLANFIQTIRALEKELATVRQNAAELQALIGHLARERDELEHKYRKAIQMEEVTHAMLNNELANHQRLKKTIERQEAEKKQQGGLETHKSENSCSAMSPIRGSIVSQNESSLTMEARVHDLTVRLNQATAKSGPFEFLNPEVDSPSVKDMEKLFERMHELHVEGFSKKDGENLGECIWHNPNEESPEEEEPLTRGDFNIFWILFTFQNLRLDVMRSIRDGDWTEAYAKMDRAVKYVNSVELGPFKIEVMGSLQYVQGYLDLLASGNVEAAELALKRGQAYKPARWPTSSWADMGMKLEHAIQKERARQEIATRRCSKGDTTCRCKLRVMPCSEHVNTETKPKCGCYFHDSIELCERHEKTFAHHTRTAISQNRRVVPITTYCTSVHGSQKSLSLVSVSAIQSPTLVGN